MKQLIYLFIALIIGSCTTSNMDSYSDDRLQQDILKAHEITNQIAGSSYRLDHAYSKTNGVLVENTGQNYKNHQGDIYTFTLEPVPNQKQFLPELPVHYFSINGEILGVWGFRVFEDKLEFLIDYWGYLSYYDPRWKQSSVDWAKYASATRLWGVYNPYDVKLTSNTMTVEDEMYFVSFTKVSSGSGSGTGGGTNSGGNGCDFYETNYNSTPYSTKMAVNFYFSERVKSAKIYYGTTSNCPLSQTASVNAKSAYATISGLKKNTKYYFKCVATCEHGKRITTSTYPDYTGL